MVSISYRESRFVPSAINYDCYPYHINPATGQPYICIGLLQVLGESMALQDPYYNVEISYQKWLLSGYTPWGY